MKHISVIVLFLIIAFNTNAQFEQKITLNLSTGVTSPGGADCYFLWDEYDSAQEKPYIFGNFTSGTFLNAGLQYNLNRNFGLGAKLRPLYLFGWSYYDLYGKEWGDNISMSLFNLGIGVNAKYKFLPQKKINPFGFVELSGNYTSLNYSYNLTGGNFIGSQPERVPFLESSFGVGYNLALGFDYNMNDHLGFFMQGGINNILIKDENFNPIYYDGKLETENFNTWYVEIGVIISFLKSKNL
mgnify:CR=1 FL=1